MNRIFTIAVAAGLALAASSSALAAQGCGPGFHRGPYGGCRPDRGPARYARGRPAIGSYHGGRGYWDGHRYYQHRERQHGGWRYR